MAYNYTCTNCSSNVQLAENNFADNSKSIKLLLKVGSILTKTVEFKVDVGGAPASFEECENPDLYYNTS
ncbi:MAG: hypothetical protein LBP35_03325 [Candidatus Ancillula trichonymphae]|nr:hypothetical protein [Candidatus Ancillula trichonymphae]